MLDEVTENEITDDKISRLITYWDMVINETLRVYPPFVRSVVSAVNFIFIGLNPTDSIVSPSREVMSD